MTKRKDPSLHRRAGPKPRPALERFTEKIEYDTNAGCWLWSANVSNKGYGVFSVGKKSEGAAFAHRFSYQTFVGEIPASLFVCHRCDTPACVNPNHLFLGSHLDNMRDMHAKGRWTGNNRGELNGQSKLTPDDVRAIRASLGTASELSNRFNVSDSNIKLIKNRKRWGHLV